MCWKLQKMPNVERFRLQWARQQQ